MSEFITNAELRIEAERLCDENERLQVENTKLHELTKKLKACNSSCNRCIELYGICEHETELQALGIEVPK